MATRTTETLRSVEKSQQPQPQAHQHFPKHLVHEKREKQKRKKKVIRHPNTSTISKSRESTQQKSTPFPAQATDLHSLSPSLAMGKKEFFSTSALLDPQINLTTGSREGEE